MEQEHVIGWGTLALLNAGLARCMNCDGVVWFFLSIFVGPLVTFGLVILGLLTLKTEPKMEDRPHRGRGDEGFPL
jgi:hypothetical protein